jgi:ornithine--oxo-acid transaminase
LEEEIAYAAAVYDLCKQHNILFIADEVRMGCGKTGRFFSCDYLGEHRQPDLLAVGKSITGGIYPASFLLGRADCLDLVGVKEVVSAYSFSPVAAIATTAALAVIDDENLLENAKHIEELFLHKAKTWAKHQFISHVIARGADLGVWLKDIDQETCRLICEICMHRGLLVFPGQLRIRMGVAMVISDDDLLRGLTILSGVFDTISMHAASMRTPKV